MPLQLMKLNVEATTTVTMNPVQEKFFHVTTADTAPGGTLTIDAAAFFNDAGDPVTALPELEAANSYYTVHINGVKQMDGISTYTPGATTVGSLVITNPTAGEGESPGPILAGTPIVLEVVNFTPESETAVAT